MQTPNNQRQQFQTNNVSIADTMYGTIYCQEPELTPSQYTNSTSISSASPNSLIPSTNPTQTQHSTLPNHQPLSLNPQLTLDEINALTNSTPTTHSQSTQTSSSTPLPEQLSPSTPNFEELGIITESSITPAVYNLWQSFASIFLSQSLVLPPSLNPLALLPYAHLVSQLQPFDLILIRTPGLFYNTMRRIVEHQNDHVAIVLTQSCALHISPPFTRIIPVATLLSPTRNPIILRPKLNPHKVLNIPPNVSTMTSSTVSITNNSLTADKLPSQHATTQNLIPTMSTTTTPHITISSEHLMDIYSQIRTFKYQQFQLQQFKQQSSSTSPPPTPSPQSLTMTDIQQYQLFIELMSLLGSAYDSIKMYTLWGKLAINRVTNQPLAKIDSTGVICTDAIVNILTQYDFFYLSHVMKNWGILNGASRFQFNMKSNHAISLSKQLVIDIQQHIDKHNKKSTHLQHHSNQSQSTFMNQYHCQQSQSIPNLPPYLTLLPQPTIYHQLPISNLEALDFHRISAWSLNDLIQLSHTHYIHPDPKILDAQTHIIQSNQSFPISPVSTSTSTTAHNNTTHSQSSLYDHSYPLPSQPTPISPSDLKPSIQHSKQLLNQITTPLLLESAFHVIKPSLPIPIELLYSFCSQLSLLCSNFVLRETTSHPTQSTSISTQQSQPSTDQQSQWPPNQSSPPTQSPTSTTQLKHNRQELLKLINPYYRPTPSPNQSSPTTTNLTSSPTPPTTSSPSQPLSKPNQSPNQQQQQSQPQETADIKTILADSLYYHLLCQITGMIPFHILQALKQSMGSLQNGKKYDLKPEVLLYKHTIKHVGIEKLQDEVKIMYNELVLEPFLTTQYPRHMIQNNTNDDGNINDMKYDEHFATLLQNRNTIPNTQGVQSSTSNTIQSSSDQMNQEQIGIGKRIQNFFSQLTTFTNTSLFNTNNISTTNPDGIDPQIQSSLQDIDLKSDPKQKIIISNSNSQSTSKLGSKSSPTQNDGQITQFPAWLQSLLPTNLYQQFIHFVNITISPIDGYREYLNSKQQSHPNIDQLQQQQHPFPSIKYLSSIPAPFLLYIWSLLKPIVRFYLLLTILSRFLPYLVYKLTATALTTLISLPTNAFSWLSSKTISTVTSNGIQSSTIIPQSQLTKPSLLKRMLGKKSIVQPKPTLLLKFQTRFITFVSAIVAASVFRIIWNNYKSKSISTLTSSNHNQQQFTSQQSWLTRALQIQQQRQIQLPSLFNNNNNNINVKPSNVPILMPIATTPNLIQEDDLNSLVPSNFIQQHTTIPISNINKNNDNNINSTQSTTLHQQPTTTFLTRALMSGYQRFISKPSIPSTSTTIPFDSNSTTSININSSTSFDSTYSNSDTTSSQSITNLYQGHQHNQQHNQQQQAPPPQSLQTFFNQTDQSLAWLNDVFKATVYVATDTLGLRTLNKNLGQSRSVKELKKQVQYIRKQLRRE